jgi:protein TonB
MSSATLASPRTHVHPDRVRIVALSAAMAINLTVFVAATRPLPPLAMPRLATPDLGIRLVDAPKPEPLPPPPPPLDVTPLRHSPQVPAVAPPVAAVRPVSDQGSVAAPITPPAIAPPAADAAPVAVPGPPIEASLAYRSATLVFPPQALRRHMHGTVLLRVLVDEDGRPVQVVVERSSGHTLLDRSAREQVLAGWRFQPASVDGHAVRAWARVPVSFELRQL